MRYGNKLSFTPALKLRSKWQLEARQLLHKLKLAYRFRLRRSSFTPGKRSRRSGEPPSHEVARDFLNYVVSAL